MAIRWTNAPAPDPLPVLPDRNGMRDVYIGSGVQAEVLAHLSDRRVEQGGLLIGRAWLGGTSSQPEGVSHVSVEKAIPADDADGSAIALRMETSVWTAARAALRPGQLIVGWYHSHPGLGAFFSHTDRRTQAAFFAQPYSVGWVLDPDDGSEAFFVGRDSLPLSGVLYCDGVGAGAAGTNGPDTWGVA